MAQRTLRDLFVDSLRDIYNAEAQLVKALGRLAAIESRLRRR